MADEIACEGLNGATSNIYFYNSNEEGAFCEAEQLEDGTA
jgi:hypothetical protein